jgi:hypothetical protein
MLLGAAAVLAGCGQSTDDQLNNGAVANNAAAPEAAKPAYCFFKQSETKDWTAKLDKSGNVVVSGKAYREDPRYKAVLTPATVTGGTAIVSPTISQNDTGFAAPHNWWAVTETIPDSEAIDSVIVKCGDQTLAKLTVPRQK